MECELCKMKYPAKLKFNDQTYDLLIMDRPTSNYIIFESIGTDRNSTRTIHIISLNNKNNIRLGRGHDSDIRISDISVSRTHATIKSTKNGLILQDNESKFGTLIQVKRPILLTIGTTIAVQCGRSTLELALKKT